jgi:hypothetical protein
MNNILSEKESSTLSWSVWEQDNGYVIRKEATRL